MVETGAGGGSHRLRVVSDRLRPLCLADWCDELSTCLPGNRVGPVAGLADSPPVVRVLEFFIIHTGIRDSGEAGSRSSKLPGFSFIAFLTGALAAPFFQKLVQRS